MIKKVAERMVGNFNRMQADKDVPWPITPAVILSDGHNAVPIGIMPMPGLVGEDVLVNLVEQMGGLTHLRKPPILGLLVVLGIELEMPEDPGQLALITFKRAFEGCELGDPTLRTDYFLFLSDGETELTYAAKVTKSEAPKTAHLGLMSADDLPELDFPHPAHFVMEKLCKKPKRGDSTSTVTGD